MLHTSRFFLFLVVAVVAASSSAQLVVTPSNTQGWQFTTSSGTGNVPPPAVYLAPGFETPPLGSGSLHLTPGQDGGDNAQARHPGYAGTLLSNITTLSYSTFVEVDGSGDQAPYLILNVDLDGNTGTTGDQTTLHFEPVYQGATFFPSNPQGPLVDDTWQTWDARNGAWWSPSPAVSSPAGAGIKSLSTIISEHPNAIIINTASGAGGVRIVTGFGAGAWDNFLGAADAFTIGVSGTNTIYNFEPAAGTVVTVTPSALDGWTPQVVDDDNDTVTTGSVTFVTGPGTPPMGDGSVQFNLGTEGEDGVQVRQIGYDGQFIRDLNALTYSTYVQTPGSDTQAPYIILDVDLNNDGTRDDLWFFEPAYQTAAFCPSNPQPAVATGSWQTWDAANGCWYSLFGTAGTGPGVNVRPLSVLLDTEPDARLSTNIAGGSFRIVTGFGDLAWDNFVGNVDAVNVSFLGSTVTYDFEPVPSITIADFQHTEGTGGTTNFVFTLTLSQAVSQTVTVNYTTADGTATAADGDYTPVTVAGTATFAPMTTSTTITITVNADNKFEPPMETFFVNLTNPQNATLADNQAVGTILNDDPQPTITIADAAQPEGNAGNTPMNFTVTLSNPSSQTITATYTIAGNTATLGTDFTATNGTVTFVPNDTSETITVQVVGDTTFEPNETLTVTLTAPTNATFADGTATGTIQNDDAQPTISIADSSATEGDAGTTPMTFTVTLSNASASTITVNYATTAGGDAVAGTDYTAANGTLTFVPGDVSETFEIAVLGDTIDEANETFNVTLNTPTNATIADGTAVGTIIDNDGVPTVTIDDVALAEGNAGTTTFTFTVTLSNASASPIAIDYTTAPGTATAGTDYTPESGTVIINAGLTGTITIDVIGDTAFEPNETFFVNLTGATNATIGDSQGLGTIVNDDGPVADLTIVKTSPAGVIAPGGQINYTITVTNAGPQQASNVVVTDVLPAGTSLISASPSQGTCTGTTTVVCTLGIIANGGGATIQLVVNAPTTEGTVSNTATVTNAPEVDPTPGGNASTVVSQAAFEIPTISEWGLLAMIAALLAMAVVKLR